jgi:hypothetical protein
MGLLDTLTGHDICTREQFEAFLVGFSQASPRFLLVDVGYGKEAADAKIKGSSHLTSHSLDLRNIIDRISADIRTFPTNIARLFWW